MKNSTGGALVIGALVVGLALGSAGVALGSGNRTAEQSRKQTAQRAMTTQQDHRSTEATPTPAAVQHRTEMESVVRETAHRAETEPAVHEATHRTETQHADANEVHHPEPVTPVAAHEEAPCDPVATPAPHDSAHMSHEPTGTHTGDGEHH